MGQTGDHDVVFWLWAPAQRPRVGAALTPTWDLGKHLYLCLLAVGQKTSQQTSCKPAGGDSRAQSHRGHVPQWDSMTVRSRQLWSEGHLQFSRTITKTNRSNVCFSTNSLIGFKISLSCSSSSPSSLSLSSISVSIFHSLCLSHTQLISVSNKNVLKLS